MHPEPAAHPVGHETAPHEFEPQVAMHEQESAQSIDSQALVPLQLTMQAPSAQSTLSHALVPEHVIWQLVAPVPQLILPHALFALQLITHDVAALQSIDEHDPPAPQAMSHA